jgi:hypothetical protein
MFELLKKINSLASQECTCTFEEELGIRITVCRRCEAASFIFYIAEEIQHTAKKLKITRGRKK